MPSAVSSRPMPSAFYQHEKRVDSLYDFRFFLDDSRYVIFAFLVTEEVFVCYADFPIRKPFPLTPGEFSDMERLSSCASEDIIVMSNSPLLSSV